MAKLNREKRKKSSFYIAKSLVGQTSEVKNERTKCQKAWDKNRLLIVLVFFVSHEKGREKCGKRESDDKKVKQNFDILLKMEQKKLFLQTIKSFFELL